MSTVSSIAAGLLIGAAILAPVMARAQAPGSPMLLNPPDGITISVPASQAPTRIFTWDAPATGPAVAFYEFALEDSINPTGRRWRQDLPAGGRRMTSQQIIPPALRGSTIRWRVAACRGRRPNPSCSAPASRLIFWPGTLEAPDHRRPLDAAIGPDAGTTTRFQWTSVSGANSYLVCVVTTRATPCPEQSMSTGDAEVVRRVGSQNTFAAPDLTRWMGRTVYWKPAACDAAGQCSWQPTLRSFTLLNPPRLINPAAGDLIVPPRYRVVFTWSIVPGASGYFLTVARSGDRFDNPAHQVAVLDGQRNNLAWEVPASLRQASGGRLKWTVAACIGNLAGGGQVVCNQQRSFRWLLLALERPLHYRVLSGFAGRLKYLYLDQADKYLDTNDPVPGTTVCLGTPEQPTRYGSARTDRDGYALFGSVPRAHYQVSAAIAGSATNCKPGFRGLGYVFCAPTFPPTGFVHARIQIGEGGLIGAINQRAHIRVRLNRRGRGPCPAPAFMPDTATAIDVD